MDEWGDEGLDVSESFDGVENVSMDTMDYSEPMDVGETLDNVENFDEVSFDDVSESNYVDSIMDSAPVEELTFDDEIPELEAPVEFAEEMPDVEDPVTEEIAEDIPEMEVSAEFPEEAIEQPMEFAEEAIEQPAEFAEEAIEQPAEFVEEVIGQPAEYSEEVPEVEPTTEVPEEVSEGEETADVEEVQEDAGVDSVNDVMNDVPVENMEFEGEETVEQPAEFAEEVIGQPEELTEEVQEQLDPHEALSNMSEYMNEHNYGREDFETYSKDPEWQALNRDLQIANGIEPTEYAEEGEIEPAEFAEESVIEPAEFAEESVVEPAEFAEESEIEPVESAEADGMDLAEEVQEQLDPHEALSNMSEYMNEHNYGMEDYETYSKDPEWQALNRDLQIANGIEPTEYAEEGEIESAEFAEEGEVEAAEFAEEGEVEAAEFAEEGEVEAAEFAEEGGAEAAEFAEADGMEPTEPVERVYDDFEESVLEQDPEFYETGRFYQQGINEFGYEGTCGPTSQANAINELLGTNELTENKVLSVAIDNQLCCTNGDPSELGGTSTKNFMELYDKMNEQLGDKFETELYEYDNCLDAEQVADRLENGSVINIAVDSCRLWDEPRDYVDAMGVRHDDFYSDHWITVTGVERMENGAIEGFNIIDSGGGESYVSLDKYNEMCFGTAGHRVMDPTCIVLSKK